MKTTVSSRGQIVLPAEIRREDDIREGQVFEVERLDRGEYRLVRRETPANEGLVDDWLLARHTQPAGFRARGRQSARSVRLLSLDLIPGPATGSW